MQQACSCVSFFFLEFTLNLDFVYIDFFYIFFAAMAAAGHMNMELPARLVLCSRNRFLAIFRKTYLHDDLANGSTVGGDVEEDPNGGHCALDGLDPSGFSEDASVDLLEGSGRVKPAERPRLASNAKLRPAGKLGSKVFGLKAGLRKPGRRNTAGRGPRAGLEC